MCIVTVGYPVAARSLSEVHHGAGHHSDQTRRLGITNKTITHGEWRESKCLANGRVVVDGNEFILCVREERERQRERKVTVYEKKGRREGMKGEQREGRRGEGR